MDYSMSVNRNTYLGLFFITLSTLMYEILLTRIFSVLTYYHFAFMSISIAMFGLTLGSLIVYLRGDKKRNFADDLAFNALLFSITIIVSLLILLNIPLSFHFSFLDILTTVLIYFIISIPFIFSGICVCLALTKFPQKINRLYATDLLGAALGCIVVIALLNFVDAITAIFCVVSLAGMGSLFFSKNINLKSLEKIIKVLVIVFLVIATMNAVLFSYNLSPFKLKYAKNNYEAQALYEKWNAFSRITITGDPNDWRKPFAWGLSKTYPQNKKVRYLVLHIDSGAATPLLNYQGNFDNVDYLKYDVTNIAHYLRANADVLVIGVGGGRDILSALSFHQKSILGIEVNRNILDVITHKYNGYIGDITKAANVKLINDEARSYITRSKDKFDIIQMSLIDTWSAATSGAYMLTENALYTIEAWQIFLSKLKPHGILSVSRWYIPHEPAEIERLLALAKAALQKSGISNPDEHLLLLAGQSLGDDPIAATLLVSKEPFIANDISLIKQIIRQFQFLQLDVKQNVTNKHSRIEFDLSPPTDNKPFFFQLIKPNSIFTNYHFWQEDNLYGDSVKILFVLLISVMVLTLLCIFMPLILTSNLKTLKGNGNLLLYFLSIGLGFMFIEMSQMQRLSLFLGYPIYGLAIVLFGLLLSTSLGSLFFSKVKYPNINQLLLLSLLFLLCVIGFFYTDITYTYQSADTLTRILIAFTIVFVPGFCMGGALPIGIQHADWVEPKILSWLWGVNGAASICGSVLAVIVAILFGISVAFWIGVGCYFMAFLFYLDMSFRFSRIISA